ncbi:MAG: TRAP transporter large permease subunit, partial [Hyphomicrobium sp.]
TSFLHPPFGFALFFLRSVAARVPYLDRVTGKEMQPVTTEQIYWGAVPFVVIQLAMVGALIAFPGLVLRGDRAPATPQPPGVVAPQPKGGISLPALGLPGASLGGPSMSGPSLGTPSRGPRLGPGHALRGGDGGPSLPQTSPFDGPNGGPILPSQAPPI